MTKQIIFWGSPQFSVACFTALADMNLIRGVVSREPKPQGRSHGTLVRTPIHETAAARGIPVVTPAALQAESLTEELSALLPATFFVVAYGRIIPENILSLSELPAINLHPSLLPILRGPSPIQSAILHGHTQTGLSLMQLDAEMDHGPLVAQKKITVAPEDTYTTLSEKLSLASVQFVQKYIPPYLADELRAIPQEHSRATFSAIIRSDDGRLDPEQDTAHEMDRKIRALNEWPGAYILWGVKRLRIHRARPLEHKKNSDTSAAKPFFLSPTGSLCIQTRDGVLETVTVQLEGSKPMHSQDFARGHRAIVS